jgi:purine-cytosine permease-like protein
MMLYRKNLRGWEQIIRIVAGAAMIAGGLLGLPGNPVGYLIAVVGLVTALTGVFGYCPGCAMVGRKITERSP